MFIQPTKYKLARLNYLFILTFVALICAALWGNSQLISAAPTANTIAVTTTDDGLNEDGKCALREALHNANTNSKFSDSPGECVPGSASETDVIVLTSGDEYILNIAGAGDDQGDLDVLANGLPLDLRLEVDDASSATMRVNNGLNDRVLEIHGATVEIENITLRNGLTGDNGGGILNDSGTLSLTQVTLQNNVANAGGGLYNLNGTVVISNSQLILNNGALGGGGVLNSGLTATLTLQGGTMVRVNESTGGSGGGVANNEGVVQVLDNTAVNLNTAAISGGGIFNSSGGQLIITASSVEGNTATDAEGGGIYVEGAGSSLTLTNSTVINNKALQDGTGYGGGVMVANAATAVINTSDIRENEAYVGGGLFNDAASLTLTDSTVFTNTVTNGGGGLVNREGDVTATAVTVQGNEAVSPGGGIYNLDGTMTIHNSTLRGNITQAIGAGLLNNGGTFTMTASVVQGNQAAAGGGFANGGGLVTLDDVVVENNVAYNGVGGALTNENGQVIIRNGSLLTQNASSEGGGAIYNADGSQVTLTETTLESNSTNGLGGAIYSGGNGSSITAVAVQFEANAADLGDGGALYITNGSEATFTASNLSDNRAINGGAVYASDTSGTVTLTRAGVYSNTATGNGGAFWTSSVFAVNNSTVSGNEAVNGGGLYVAGTGSATAVHTTFAHNTLFDLLKEGDATLTLLSTIIATPATDNCFIVGSDIFSMGGNVSDDASCGGLNHETDQTDTDPLLAGLADNGGDTLTHALLESSPALGAADGTACTAEPINGLDQRGFTRTGETCDSGAYEAAGTPPAINVYLPLIMR